MNQTLKTLNLGRNPFNTAPKTVLKENSDSREHCCLGNVFQIKIIFSRICSEICEFFEVSFVWDFDSVFSCNLIWSPSIPLKKPFSSTQKTPQFQTKKLSVQHTPSFNTPLSSPPKIPQFNTPLSWVSSMTLFWCWSEGFVELRDFGVELRVFLCWNEGFWMVKRCGPCVELRTIIYYYNFMC